MKNLFLFYLLPKGTLLISLIYLLPFMFGQSYFKFEDYPVYNNCLEWTANPFFGYIVCLINSENIANAFAIIVAILINTIRDLGFIYLIKDYITNNAYKVFCLLLALHPYLTLYHAKLTTSTFAGLGVLLIYYLINRNIKINIFYYFLGIILVGFRQSQILMFLYFYLIYWYQNFKNNKLNSLYLLLFLISLAFLMSLSSLDYFSKVTRLSFEYPTNMYISKFINIENYHINLILSKTAQIFIHVFLLLGFREKAYTEFPGIFISGDLIDILQIFIGFILILIHSLGIYGFYKYNVRRNILYLSFLFYIFPTVILTGHLRYLLPVIPLILIGFVLLFEKYFEKIKFLNKL